MELYDFDIVHFLFHDDHCDGISMGKLLNDLLYWSLMTVTMMFVTLYFVVILLITSLFELLNWIYTGLGIQKLFRKY